MTGSDALPRTASILVVDEQTALCDTLKRFLSKRRYRVEATTKASAAIELLDKDHFDLLVVCTSPEKQGGLELLEHVKSRGRGEDVIVMTSAPSIDKCVEAMRLGAIDYISKPFQLNEIGSTIEQALRRRAERTGSKGDLDERANSNGHGSDKRPNHPVLSSFPSSHVPLIGNSPVMRHLSSMIDRISRTNSSVLLTGRTGTGKELIARAIHERSARSNGPFVDINCSAIPDTLIEAELFGHQRGTFTGAHETRRGLFEEASGGTLFLDEVDALNLPAQAKLLRVLQERRLRRVGGRENIPIDVRIISASNRNIQAAVTDGLFRPDLLFRLRVIPLHSPELRERGEDIKLLMNHFLRRIRETYASAPARSFSAEATRLLMSYNWPGNVRELENAVEYALTVATGEEIEVDDLPGEIAGSNSSDYKPWLESIETNLPLAEVERLYILSTFKRCGRHQIKTAVELGIDRRTLYRKLQQYGMISSSKGNLYEAFSA